MLRLNVTEKVKGPIFSEIETSAIINRYIEDAEVTIADHGVNMVKAQLDLSLKTQTPYYKTHIVTDRSVGDISVTDSGVIYGPWLEGVGSRNATTRFKGYHTFRIVGQQLDSMAVRIAEDVLPIYLRELNG
jgi:hypothetical protein